MSMDGAPSTLPEPAAAEPAPAAQPAATSAAPAPADPFADFGDFIPKGSDAKAFIRETLAVRQRIDNTPGGLDAIVQSKALEIAPQLAEQLLRSPEGQKWASKIAMASAREQAGEETPEDKRILELTEKTEAAMKRAETAEAMARSNAQAQLTTTIKGNMESEFNQALREQPELREFADDIRERIGNEGKADPRLLEPGWVKQRALDLYSRYAQMTQRAAPALTTRGRTSGTAGGATAAPKDPTTLSRDEAAELMASLMSGSS